MDLFSPFVYFWKQNTLDCITRHCAKQFDEKIHRLLDFTENPRDISDPWYTGDFESTYRDVLEGCEALLGKISDISRN